MRVGRTFLAVAVVAVAVVASASAASSAQRASDVVRALRSAGFPVGRTVVWTEASDPNALMGRPGQYVSKATFRDGRVPNVSGWSVDDGGDVEVFRSPSDARRRYLYVKTVTQSSSLLSQWVYLEGRVLLRLSHVLTPSQARRYERAFRAIV